VETRVRTPLGLEERNVTSRTTTCSSVHLSNRRSLVAISCHSTTCANGEVWLVLGRPFGRVLGRGEAAPVAFGV
jgi:hypothetical protein